VGTHNTLSPAATLTPSASTKHAAVEPVPRPSHIPSQTRSSARNAALSLSKEESPCFTESCPFGMKLGIALQSQGRDMPGRSATVNAISQERMFNVPRANLRDATIVFDLDGTLVDTAPDLTKALNDALIRRGHAAIPQETIRSAVGFGARVMIEEALRRAGAAEDIEEMLSEFLVPYEANIAAESRPFPGAVASFEALAASGARLAICTNKREYLTRKLLEALSLQHYFHGIAGRDTFAVSKPDPGHLLQVIAQAGG